MLTENNNRVLAHISGLSLIHKDEFKNLWKNVYMNHKIKIIDLDKIMNIVMNDTSILSLQNEIDRQEEPLKNNKLIYNQQKEKEMSILWKKLMEEKINENVQYSKKDVVLIGSIIHPKNKKLFINLTNINYKFFIKVNYDIHSSKIIEFNLDKNRNDIINGNFDISFIDKQALIKKRMSMLYFYKKLYYSIIPLNLCVNSISILNHHFEFKQALYLCSNIKYEKKIIPDITNETNLIFYTQEIYSLISPIISNCNFKTKKKIIKNNISIEISKEHLNNLNNKFYFYETLEINQCIPIATKNEIYKFISNKPIKINKFLIIDNLYEKLKELNIKIIT